MNTQEQKKLSESLLAACKAAGIGMPRFIAQDKDGDIYHYKNKPFLKVNCDAWIHQNDGIYSGIDHPPYATNWQESLLEWVDPQGEPLADVLARHPDHIADTSKMIDACDIAYQNRLTDDTFAITNEGIYRQAWSDALAWWDGNDQPSGIEALVCADIAKRQQVGIAKYGTTLADNPLTLLEGLQHLRTIGKWRDDA